jgi:16S rRNA (guanine527-N7)-methyltransferase
MTSEITATRIEAAVDDLGLQPLAAGIADKFQTYLTLLLKWNTKLNLTAIRDPETILRRHFLECIFLAQQLPSEIHTLLDFGSGGGFPGLPIALCRPEIHAFLGESQGKKAAFLREAVRALGVNATVLQDRIESVDRQFDAVALRAVDKMREAVHTAQPKVAPNGWLILFATVTSEAGMRSSPPDWSWQTPLPIPGSDQGLLLFGQRL